MKAAQELRQKAAPLHILVNNAGEHQYVLLATNGAACIA
jgi:hypothetical protein